MCAFSTAEDQGANWLALSFPQKAIERRLKIYTLILKWENHPDYQAVIIFIKRRRCYLMLSNQPT